MSGLPRGFAPHRIVLLKPCCIGDVLMTTPLARSLKAAWPAATIDWAVGGHSRAVLAGNPDVHALLDASGTMRGDLSLGAIVRLVLALRRGRYDAAFIAERSPLPAAIARLAGIPVRVGLDSGGRGRLHTVRVPAQPDDPRHETDIYLDLARAVGAPATDPRPVFVPSPADVEAARAVVEAVETARGGPLPRPWLIVHPGGGQNPGAEHLAKRWPAARFGVIAARVAARLGGSAILVGGPDDVRLGGDVLAGAVADRADRADIGPDGPDEPGGRDRVVDATGRLSLGATAALVAHADAYLGNDSGVAHLAAAVGTPVVAIFGPTS
ncbi:MAG: glycosyltransferase family 9 protein, partial [Ardenticatenales bacterium]